MTEALVQLKAFARIDGALLALLWVASFAALLLQPSSAAGNLLALCTPFFVGWRLCRFRSTALDGHISFRRGYAYAFYDFFYAALLFAVAQYVYFRWMDHGHFLALVSEAMKVLGPVYEQSGMTAGQLSQTADMMATLTPMQWAFVFMMQNIFIGIVVSLPIAALCAKRH